MRKLTISIVLILITLSLGVFHNFAFATKNKNIPPTPTATPSCTPTPNEKIPTPTEVTAIITGILPSTTSAQEETIFTSSVAAALIPTETPGQTQTATAETSNSGGSSSQNAQPSNQSAPAVLGTTTLASTGIFAENLMKGYTIIGMLLLLLGYLSFFKEKYRSS